MRPLRHYTLAVAALSLWLCLIHPAEGFYNPSTGRWLSRDPVEERGGVNTYTFVRNGLKVDPFGLAELHYIDHPKWTPAPAAEFLWVAHYLTFTSSDAQSFQENGNGLLLLRHQSEALITDCATGKTASPRSGNWYFANNFVLDSSGKLLWANEQEDFTDGEKHVFDQIVNASIPGMLRHYGTDPHSSSTTKGALHSVVEFRVPQPGTYNIFLEPWIREMPGYQIWDIKGHEFGRDYYGYLGSPPLSWQTEANYSVRIEVNFKWDDCCADCPKWDFRSSPALAAPGADRERYAGTQYSGSVNLLERPNSGNW